MNKVLTSVGAFALVVLVMGPAMPLVAQGSRWSLTINNRSMFAIHGLFVSSSEESDWGRDLLGTRILHAGGAWSVTNLRTGEYDVRLIDQDGDDCIRRNQQITGNTSWNVSTDWLLRCEFH